MMERRQAAAWRLPLAIGAGLLAAYLLRRALLSIAVQLSAGALMMAAALPLCRRLERRMGPAPAAILSLLLLAAGAALLLMTMLPPAVRQVRQLTAELPGVVAWAQEAWQRVTRWFSARGLDIAPLQEELFSRLSSGLGVMAASLADSLRRGVASAGRLLLAPLLAFYLLRDRRRIAAMLTLLLPISCRARGVRAAREMRRETAAYLRGQLLLSIAVGLLTALGLLLTGTPGWLLLGLLMGVMELIPYIGPVIAGLPAVLLALRSGWLSALWTLGVLILVQQVEGAVLSPRLLGSATQLHPMAVLLLIPAGGMLMGPVGMIAVLPAVVALRGAVRGWRA